MQNVLAKDFLNVYYDLTKPGVDIMTQNPKTGGAPRWIDLSAWGYALKQPGGTEIC